MKQRVPIVLSSAALVVAVMGATPISQAARHAIAAVPPGSYTLALWHEKLGRAERPVTVPPGATVSVDLTLSAGR